MKIGRKCLEIFSLAKIIPQTLVPPLLPERGQLKSDGRGVVIFSLSLSPSPPLPFSILLLLRVEVDESLQTSFNGHGARAGNVFWLIPLSTPILEYTQQPNNCGSCCPEQTTAKPVRATLPLSKSFHSPPVSLPATRSSNFPNFFPSVQTFPPTSRSRFIPSPQFPAFYHRVIARTPFDQIERKKSVARSSISWQARDEANKRGNHLEWKKRFGRGAVFARDRFKYPSFLPTAGTPASILLFPLN